MLISILIISSFCSIFILMQVRMTMYQINYSAHMKVDVVGFCEMGKQSKPTCEMWVRSCTPAVLKLFKNTGSEDEGIQRKPVAWSYRWACKRGSLTHFWSGSFQALVVSAQTLQQEPLGPATNTCSKRGKQPTCGRIWFAVCLCCQPFSSPHLASRRFLLSFSKDGKHKQ